MQSELPLLPVFFTGRQSNVCVWAKDKTSINRDFTWQRRIFFLQSIAVSAQTYNTATAKETHLCIAQVSAEIAAARPSTVDRFRSFEK